MKKFSRFWVLLFALILTQSSLGTKADLVNARGISQNGYKKYEDGMLIQWGTNTSTAQHRTVYFPTSFLDAYYSVVTTPQSPANINVVTVFSTNTYTKSSFMATGAFRGLDSSYGYPGEPFRWFAIGRWK